MHTRQRMTSFALLSTLMVLLLASGCSPRSSLLVDYHVSDISDRIEGRQVRLQVRDVRTDRRLFSSRAEHNFEDFEGSYDLTIVTADNNRVAVGEKDLQGLFFEAIKRRLEHLGITVVASADEKDQPLFQVLIKEFKVDLQERKWIASASYEANLSIDNQLVARELVSGSAERIKIMGSKGADTTLSDIFTEIINRLNIVKLFQQAKMV